MSKELYNKLKELAIEDYIWVIYVGIIILSWVSNHYERLYFINHDVNNKNIYKKIMTIIFSILVVVYLYFLKNSIDDIKNLKKTDSYKKKNMVYLSFVGSVLIAISGFIYLFITLVDEDLDVEIAFN